MIDLVFSKLSSYLCKRFSGMSLIANNTITDGPTSNGDFDVINVDHEDPKEADDLSPSVRLRSIEGRVSSRSTTVKESSRPSSGDGFTSRQQLPHDSTLPSTRYLNLRVSLSVAFLFRIALLLFSVWQDTTRWPDGQLRFTDVDYDVFTDAARALVSGEDIYNARPTYRYSPLIAALVAPGHWLFRNRLIRQSPSVNPKTFFDPPLNVLDTQRTPMHTSTHGLTSIEDALSRIWGKLVFIIADLICAWLQYNIIIIEAMPETIRESSEGIPFPSAKLSQLAVLLVSFAWLFNPVTAVVSVRGNAEAVLGVCVLACLALILRRRLFLAGLFFGLCIHLKLYPVIYAPAIYLWLSQWSCKPSGSIYSRLCCLIPSRAHFAFALGTLLSLGLFTTMGYLYFGGMVFLHQAYLYHFTRIDMKHNFAPHFYPFYLLSGLQWKMLDMKTVTGLLNYGTTRDLLFRQLSALMGMHEPTVQDNLTTWIITQCALNADVVERVFNIISTLQSLVLIPGLSFKLCGQLGLCWFAVTYAFVTFNKVCTSQYFLWSLVLLPIALAQVKVPSNRLVIPTVVEMLLMWLAPQALWLASAYTLEMRTPSSQLMARWVWILVWCSSLVFLLFNIILLRRLIKWRKLSANLTTADPLKEPDSHEVADKKTP
ncbi:GPI mannosyltransferase 1 [Clonorchis sinensis]|uniref:GPI alpha-1,4-mannosyltransferase I, catalytic subunit n=1 Tax=Clonorchis sinensis TaxID=79923 RepID=A0A3R7C9T8_CLOSI|nr:GPI mannosyltransferase 1 [Clonorchis sinensis]